MNKKQMSYREKIEFYYKKNFKNQKFFHEIARYIKEKAISLWKSVLK